MSDTDAADLIPDQTSRVRRNRWRAVITLLGFAGLVVAAVTTVDDARDQALPGPGYLAAALALQFVAMLTSARAWASLFPPTADRTVLTRALYVSQLTKYLPAGGFVQAASQVALSTQQHTGLGQAAFRLPIFSLCTLVAGGLASTVLVFNADLPAWGRGLALCGLASVLLLNRTCLAWVLRAARRVVRRLPDPSALPPQAAILRCFGFAAVNMAAYGAAFALLVSHVDGANPVWAGAAFCAAWAAGYVVLPIPSGLGIREAVTIAALPGLPTGALLAASVAHRVTGFIAEATLAGLTQIRIVREHRAARVDERPAVPSDQ